MIDVNKKLEKIEKNCYETAKKELKELKDENDEIISEKVLEKENLYKEELTKKYVTEINKIEREYNRTLFDYEMEKRIKVNDFKQNFKNQISSQVKNEILIFVNSLEYKDYLFKLISETLEKISQNRTTKLYVTENDFYKFKDELQNTFNIGVEKINNENIGGCIIVDQVNKISIDNTLKNSIEEKIKLINL